jgi:hypothetical protein
MFKAVRNKSQKTMIREALMKGAKLTPLVALNSFGCLRLASPICELRQEGYDIITNMIPRGNGYLFAEYSLTK